jgi:nicotinamidase-related amidase
VSRRVLRGPHANGATGPRWEDGDAGENRDLHGNAPDKAETVLLLIDVINDLQFPEGEQLLRFARPMSLNIPAPMRRAREARVPVIFANDNFGRWQSDFHKQVEHCLKDGARGRPVVELPRPDDEDYCVLKSKHSGFFSTTLDILLEYLQVRTVVLTGFAGNICVLFIANDAYTHDFHLVVLRDSVTSNTEEDNALALCQMREVLKTDTRPLTELAFRARRLERPDGSGSRPKADRGSAR